MTRIEDYYSDLNKVWNAIGLLGSILIAFIVVLVSHLIWGGR